MKNLIFIIFLVISNTMFSQGFINILVEGENWVKSFTESDINVAGNDYNTSFESSASQTFLTISPNNKNNLVHVYVTRSNNNWHNNLKLRVRRTSNGNNQANSNIYGGTEYHYISDLTTEFFTCRGYPNDVALQYEITGLSVLLPVKSYSATIMYTVMYQ